MTRKIFAGDLIRRRREAIRLTQAAMAKRLGISATYINQIEANQRPLTAALLMDVARTLRLDVNELSDDGPERLAAYLSEMLADPLFQDAAVGPRELRSLALAAPNLARAMLDLHAGYRRMEEKFRGLDDLIQGGGSVAEASRQRPFAFDEVRDFFHFIGNYVDSLDRGAEALAESLWGEEAVSYDRLADHIGTSLGTRVQVLLDDAMGGLMSRYDKAARRLSVSRGESVATRKFLLACHIATRAEGELIEEELRKAGFRAASHGIARLALANYFAGALLMPYSRFLAEARRCRHDVERLAEIFGVSIEQVCHRLSTLQRPGEEGVPFYFLRVDRAGNITKRHSATRLQFARYGGACPLWNIHEAFEMPDRLLIQVAEMPDGVRYLSMAHAITKRGASFGAPERHYAIGFGCELTHAGALVYSDAVDLRASTGVARIGTNCRLCERADCHQRAVPPYDAVIVADTERRGLLPYGIAGRHPPGPPGPKG